MKNLFNLSGSIAKKEILVPIEKHILSNTSVSEASTPYANYYGQLPQKAKPNSIFFHTYKFYFLEEVLSCAKGAEKCLLERINIACVHIYFKGKQYPAIRVKNFADYTQIASLQECLMSKGIEFASNINICGEVEMHVNKLFVLEEVVDSIYFDLEEKNKAYFLFDQNISADNFEQIITTMKHNTNCKLFDAVKGEILLNGNVQEIVRVFAEGIEITFMECLRKEFNKQLTLAKT